MCAHLARNERGWSLGLLKAWAWLAVGVVLAISTSAVSAPNPPADLTVRTSPVTGLATFVTAADGGAIPLQAAPPRAQIEPMDLLVEYGGLFGLTDPARQLALDRTQSDALGYTHTTYQQVHAGVPVFSGVLKVHQNGAGQVTAANGDFYPIPPELNTVPTLTSSEAESIAAAVTGGSPQVEHSEVVVVDPGWYGDPMIGAHLAYYVILSDPAAELREAFFVEAHTGAVLDRWNLIETARNREIHDALMGSNCCYDHSGAGCDDTICRDIVCNYPYWYWSLEYCCDTVWDSTCAYVASWLCGTVCLPGPLARSEGEPPLFTIYTDVNTAYDYFGDTYDYYFRAFGRDSIDGGGMTMVATVDSQATFCPNASWNPALEQMVFCAGTVTDDIVGHELTHGVTQFTASLIYQNQSGQLNESFSDVFGELIDLFNGNAAFAGDPGGTPWPTHPTGPGTDTPNNLRTSACSLAAGAGLIVNSPPAIAGTYLVGSADFGPPLTTIGITGDVVEAHPPRACDVDLPFTNAADLNGRIALVDRGTCTFTEKVHNAQDVGAIAVIVVNNVAGPPPGMTGADPTITIPSVMVSQSDGAVIRTALATQTVNVTLKDFSYADGVRWLTGEDADVFGGAIRDMWNPPCFGDPDRANSPLQVCAEGDNGGVHSGSGIPNHAFALAVDGGTFNGYTANGLGPIKAGAIWYRALTVYLTPASEFQDAYYAMLLAAGDLVGTTPLDPRTGLPSASALTTADAIEVGKALRAVEMDTLGRCGAVFRALNTGSAPVCPLRRTIYKDDFDHGVNGWLVEHSGPSGPAANPYDWVQSSGSLPQGRAGTAWFCEDLNSSCAPGSPSEAARHSLITPSLALPPNLVDPGFIFTHYLDVETGWDGGNLSIEVNGGPWQSTPASAIVYNSYNLPLYSPPSNTNPLAGEWAWTGSGGWGTTVVDLTGFITGGESIRVRFDFGKDGCGGRDGWYLDDFEIFDCDCNTNGIADAADIAAGTSLDCDSNGYPDDCEIAENPNRDCDHNGVIDTCQTDSDGDGVIDPCDPCPAHPFISPGRCGCGVPETDTDGDGVPDCVDLCPDNSGKDNPGICGCSVSDQDTDGDGIPDCNDQCPNEHDFDSDGDGVLNCHDLCPFDANKTAPGQCGCGLAEGETDGDGTPDCKDLCPNDPNKTFPGGCGCGIPDTDTDGDGIPDCIDGTPQQGAAQSVEITGPDEVLIGQQVQYVAELIFADGTSENVSDRVAWKVMDIILLPGRSRPSVGDAISPNGLLTVSPDRTVETILAVQALFNDGPVNLQGAKLVNVVLEQTQPTPSPTPEPGNETTNGGGGIPTPQPSSGQAAGRSPCGVGLITPLALGLLLVGLVRTSRPRRDSAE